MIRLDFGRPFPLARHTRGRQWFYLNLLVRPCCYIGCLSLAMPSRPLPRATNLLVESFEPVGMAAAPATHTHTLDYFRRMLPFWHGKAVVRTVLDGIVVVGVMRGCLEIIKEFGLPITEYPALGRCCEYGCAMLTGFQLGGSQQAAQECFTAIGIDLIHAIWNKLCSYTGWSQQDKTDNNHQMMTPRSMVIALLHGMWWMLKRYMLLTCARRLLGRIFKAPAELFAHEAYEHARLSRLIAQELEQLETILHDFDADIVDTDATPSVIGSAVARMRPGTLSNLLSDEQ